MKDNSKQKLFSQNNSLPFLWVIVMLIVIVIIFLLYIFMPMSCSWNDFLLNLGTEMIGVFVSVIFIDWLIKKHTDKKWVTIDEKIQKQLEQDIILILSDFIGATYLREYYMDEIDSNEIVKNQNGLINAYWNIINSENIQSNLNDSINKFEATKFNNLKRITENSEQRIYHILNKYEFRLKQSPTFYTFLDKIVEHIKDLKINLNIISEIGDTGLSQGFDTNRTMKDIFTGKIKDSLVGIFKSLQKIKEY